MKQRETTEAGGEETLEFAFYMSFTKTAYKQMNERADERQRWERDKMRQQKQSEMDMKRDRVEV